MMMKTGKRQEAGGKRGRALARGGYSFPEVMFAVVVLGIGFIMLAAIFPVAVRQSKLTGDETRALALARSVVGQVTGLAVGSDAPDADFYRWAFVPPKDPDQMNRDWKGPTITLPDGLPLHVGNSLFPATGLGAQPGAQQWFTRAQSNTFYKALKPSASMAPGRVFPVYSLKGWDWLRGNEISANDARYGSVLLYRRDGDPNLPPSYWSPVMQVYVILAQARGRTLFENSETGPDVAQQWTNWRVGNPKPGAWSSANLFPRFAYVRMTNDYRNLTQPSDGPGPDLLQLDSKTDPYGMGGGLSEGSYVVISETGKVYQLGSSVSPGQWELIAGNDMADSTENTGSGAAQLGVFLGRERTFTKNDPVNGKPIFSGPAQDIYMYTAVVPIRKEQ